MSRKFFQITFSILLLAGMIFGLAIKDGALANALQAPAAQGNPTAKIEAQLLIQLNAGSADFIVTMTEQADVSAADQMLTKEEKGQYVFDTLVATASRTQADIRALLDSQSVDYQSFYIFNGLWIKNGSLELAQTIASRNDVSAINANHPYQLDPPINPKPSTAEPNFVEPNISFVKADQVWALGYTGQGTVMGDDDTGLDNTHPAIAPHYRGCVDPPACTTWDHNYNWYDAWDPIGHPVPWDDYGHGTHTAGTMVGDDGAGNQIGMAPGAELISCKNMVGGGGDDAHFIICFQWNLAPWDLNGENPLPDMAPDAVNNSWGYFGGGVTAFREVIDNLLAAGIVVEVSAGNEGSGCQTLRSPGDYQEVFTTGSVNHANPYPGTITGFSSRGPSVLDGNYFPDFMAPGENVRSSLPGNNYDYWSGTSMAGPHVVGLIGLLWSANPALIGQVATTYDIIRQTVTPLTGQNGSNCGGDYDVGPNNDWGYGTIDAYNAALLAISYGGAGTLQGTVTDAVTGLPVAGVSVQAVRQEGGSWSGTTDGAGFYNITVAAGTFDITASHPQYMSATVTGVVVAEDGTTIQDFNLTPRGWAFGYVYDFDNGTGIAGATVTAEEGSFATTDVNGYYELWLDPGEHTLTASAANYAPVSAVVTIESGLGTQQDFNLLAAVVFIPSPIAVNVPLGNTFTQPATILNRLPTDYAFEFQEKDQGYQPVTGGQVKVDVKASPLAAPANTAVAAIGYTARPAGSISIERNSGINQANVLLLAADDDGSGSSPIRDMLVAYGDLGAVDLFDARYTTPTLDQLMAYNVVVVWANYTFMDANAIGNVLADYVDAGGKVIDLNFALDPSFGYQGRFRSEGYSAMTIQYTNYSSSCLGTFDPSHPIMDGVTDVCEIYRGYGTVLTAGSYEVARWQDNELFVAAKDDGSVATINGYVGIYYQWTGQMADVLHNAINYLAVPADVPWLSEVPISGTVPAEGSLPVDINFDASPGAGITQPGTYLAELTVKGDPKVKVPVSMFVEAPADWGRLDGTVNGLGYCDANPAPLEGATVEIVGVATLTTDAAGYYATWLPEGTYTVNVTADGHLAGTATVVVIAQNNVTQNFDLRWDQPCITETPPTMSVTLDMGASTTVPMTLTNNGAGLGTFEMSDLEKSYTPMRQGFLPAAVRPATPNTTPSSTGLAPNARMLSGQAVAQALSVLTGEQGFAEDVNNTIFLTFLNDNPGVFTNIANEPGTAWFAGDFINGDFSTEYVLDYYSNSLYAVDTATGATTLIGPSVPGGGESWTGMTGSSDGTMYASATTCGSSTLYTVDLGTGALTTIGSISNGACVIDLAITPDGTLFGVDIVADNLLSIDPATGAGTVIGYIGFDANYAQGMDYEETTGTLYLAAFNLSTFQGELRIADPATGNSTLVGAFQGAAEVDALAWATGGADAPWLSENPASGTIPGTGGGLSYVPPEAASVPAKNLGMFGESNVSGSPVVQSPVPQQELLLDQQPNQVNGLFTDVSCELCPLGVQVVAENFAFSTGATINQILFWTGYYPGDTPIDPDHITVIFHEDSAGVPGPVVYTESDVAYTREQTGIVLFGVHEYLHTLTLASQVALGPGSFWVEIYNDTGDSPDMFFWETGNPDTVGNGLVGSAWAEEAPGSLWNYDPTSELAIQLVSAPSEGNSQVIDVTFDAGMVTQPGTYTGQVKAKTNDPVNKTKTVDVTMFVTAPADWGQLSGTVTGLGYCDVNPAPLKGAQVAIEGGLTVETDANGFYLLWLQEGTYNVTVTADGHTVGNATVVIEPGGEMTVQNFDLRWLKPCLTEAPPSLEVTLDLGQTATQQLTLNNTGAAEGTFSVSDSDKGYTPKLAQKPPMPLGDPITPQGASSNAKIQPFVSRINANDVLLITTTDTSQSVEKALTELGYAYDLFSGSPWTGIDFTPYSTVLVAMDGGLAEIADIAKLRTDVIDQGKNLIFLGGTCYQPFAQGMNQYLVLNDTNNYCWQVTNPPQWTLTDPTHPLADGLPDNYNFANSSAGYYSIRVNDPDIEQVAMNGEGWPSFFRKSIDGDFIWFIDSVYSFYWSDPNDYAFLKQLINNSMIGGGGDALWLTEDPTAGTVAPDVGTQTIDVTFDAGMVTQPGVYMAEIKIKTNDPVNSKFVIPATMNVNGPPDWGRIEGDVSSLGYCDLNPALLKGATVEIVGFATLTTDKFGHYSTWLPEGTYTVNVTADGHVGATATVVIVAQDTTTQNFDLRLLTPCLSEAPASLDVTMALNQVKSVPLTLTNTGAAEGTFQASDLDKGFVPMRQGFLPAAVRPTNPVITPSSTGQAPNTSMLSGPAVAQALAEMAGELGFAEDVNNTIFFSFLNDNPGVFTNIANEPGTAWFAGDFINGDFSTLYVEDYYSNSLYAVDTATGAVTLIGPSVPGGGESWTGLTGSVDGTMYGSATTCGSSTLYTVDLSSGALTTVGPITNGACVIDLAITNDGTLFGIDIVADNLLSIDPATGAGTVIGYIGFDANYAQGMDYEETNGTLYLAAFNNSSFQGELRIADPATGNSTLVGAFQGGAEVDALGWASGGGEDALWLTENPTEGTVAPDGGQSVIQAVFDSNMVSELGTYTAEITIKTNDAVNKKFVVPVTMHVVPAFAPEVSFTSNSPVLVGTPMVFTNTSDPGSPEPTEWLWDFGDGITQTVGTMDPLPHVYATFGTFTVTLTACNDAGCDSFTADVVVLPKMFYLPFVNK